MEKVSNLPLTPLKSGKFSGLGSFEIANH
jgi:hypothetical protein